MVKGSPSEDLVVIGDGSGCGIGGVGGAGDRPRRSDCTTGQMDGEAGWWTTSGNIGLPH